MFNGQWNFEQFLLSCVPGVSLQRKVYGMKLLLLLSFPCPDFYSDISKSTGSESWLLLHEKQMKGLVKKTALGKSFVLSA